MVPGGATSSEVCCQYCHRKKHVTFINPVLPMLSGKYTFLSLFLAVTLEAFDTSDEGPPPTGFPPEAKPIKAPSKGRW